MQKRLIVRHCFFRFGLGKLGRERANFHSIFNCYEEMKVSCIFGRLQTAGQKARVLRMKREEIKGGGAKIDTEEKKWRMQERKGDGHVTRQTDVDRRGSKDEDGGGGGGLLFYFSSFRVTTNRINTCDNLHTGQQRPFYRDSKHLIIKSYIEATY